MIVIVNSDTTFLSHPHPSLSPSRIDSRRPVVSNQKRGLLYISASPGSNKMRIGLRFKMAQLWPISHHRFLKHDGRKWGFESIHSLKDRLDSSGLDCGENGKLVLSKGRKYRTVPRLRVGAWATRALFPIAFFRVREKIGKQTCKLQVGGFFRLLRYQKLGDGVSCRQRVFRVGVYARSRVVERLLGKYTRSWLKVQSGRPLPDIDSCHWACYCNLA
jgi:hypothetical protein